MKNIRDFTEEEIESLREQMAEVRDRTDKRRLKIYEYELRTEFTKHQFHYRTSRTSILLAVDACTSGLWAYDEADEWIAFKDEADMTMFMLGYIEPDFKPARLV